MALTTTRRTVLAGGTMVLAGRAAAQQAATLRLYSLGWDVVAALLASEVSQRTGGRYQIEKITGFDMLEAALGTRGKSPGAQAGAERILTRSGR